MPRRKLVRFQDNTKDSLVIQPGKSEFETVRKNWSTFFGNKNPLVLELACGKGEYTVGLAPHFPDRNFVGVDIKGNRLRYGAQEAKDLGLKNVGFIRGIIQNIHEFFDPHTIEEIWIIHPDPRPRNSDTRRRLTCPRFLMMYEKLLVPGGLLKLKTDDVDLFTYSVETLKNEGRTILDQTDDLYNDSLLADHFDIKTHYEQKFHQQGRTIHYLKAIKNSLTFNSQNSIY
ncbi:tRNA (guanine-N(7)-)-methyltransferase [candidate division SR1 bacterium RAAC1_SR1_1]|nr:tRNA (guanine-N(7)-)-methyltransferase [candidate division SR1 bacterium RAAC1_SR1_1]